MITLCTISLLSLFLGSGAGYYLYDVINKAPEETITGPDGNSSLDALEQRNKKVEEALKKDTLVTEITAADIVNYAFDVYTAKEYTLVLGQGVAIANAGIKVNQTIKSTTYNTPEGFFHQKESDSSFVHAADRYYEDRESQIIHGYEASRATDWAKTDVKEYSYDDFIQAYGKLNTGNYYCHSNTPDQDHPIPEKFIGFSKEDFEQSTEKKKIIRNGALIYNLTDDTIKPVGENSKTSIEKTENGYQVVLDLDVTGNPYSVSYYAVQMKSTGNLATRPKFSECVLTFQFDSDLNPITSEFFDHYKADTGIISADTESTIHQYYYYSENNTFQGTVVHIPEINEPDFDGYALLPTEEKGAEK